MNYRFSLANLFSILRELCESLFLTVYALIVGPLGFLRGSIHIERAFLYLRILTPIGLLARIIRATVEWRLGHFDTTISQMQGIITSAEKKLLSPNISKSKKWVLMDLYTILTRAYLHAGRIDKAMQVILRAKSKLNLERLTELSDIDYKTANLVRAGLAAGKLLEGGGLATMFVKTSPTPAPKAAEPVKESKEHNSPKSGIIIPFPQN